MHTRLRPHKKKKANEELWKLKSEESKLVVELSGLQGMWSGYKGV